MQLQSCHNSICFHVNICNLVNTYCKTVKRCLYLYRGELEFIFSYIFTTIGILILRTWEKSESWGTSTDKSFRIIIQWHMILVEEANSVKSFKKSQKTKQPVVEIKFARNLFISLNLTILKTNGKHVYQGASLLFISRFIWTAVSIQMGSFYEITICHPTNRTWLFIQK